MRFKSLYVPIFVLVFSYLSHILALAEAYAETTPRSYREQYKCILKLRKPRTFLMQELERSAVNVFVKIQGRHIQHPDYTPRVPITNISVTDLYADELANLEIDLKVANLYFQQIGDETFAGLSESLLKKAAAMRPDIRILSFDELAQASIEVFDWLEYVRTLKIMDKPLYASLNLRVAVGFKEKAPIVDRIENYLKQTQLRQDTAKNLVRYYKGFRMYAVRTTTFASRFDIVRMLAAGLWIKSIPFQSQYAHRAYFLPKKYADHDGYHGDIIEMSGINDSFSNFLEYISYLRQKESATKYIIGKIESVARTDRAESLRYEAILFLMYEIRKHSTIEIFSKDFRYGGMSFEETERDFIEKIYGYDRVFFNAEEFALADDKKALTKEQFFEKYQTLLKTMRQWYSEGGGPQLSLKYLRPFPSDAAEQARSDNGH